MGIRARLLLLVVGATVPLVLLGLFSLRNEWAEARARLAETIEQQAELAAVALAEWLEAQKEPLATVAAAAAQSPDGLDVRRYMGVTLAPRGHWLDMRIIGGDGEVFAELPEGAPPLPRPLVESLTRSVNSRRSPVVETDWSQETEPRVLAAAAPAPGGRLVVARINAASFENLFGHINLPASSLLTVLDPQKRVVYRSHAPEIYLGTAVNNWALLDALGEGSSATVELESPFDGTPRIYGVARAGETGFMVTVGTATETLYLPTRAKLARFALASLLALLCTAGVALVLARSISTPMRRLSRAAGRLGAGDASARAPEHSGVAEVARLGAAFNQMAEQVREREERLRELDRLKSEFVSGVSHELRTPLTTIKTLSRLLRRGDGGEALRRKYLDTIESQCDRQIDLVLNLLDVSRIESGALDMEPGPVDVAEVVRACVTAESAAAELRDQRLTARPGESLPPVRADRSALRRALCALVENAIKYTPEGGLIEVSAAASGGEIVFDVSDTGRGISPADLPHVFEKFYRGGQARPSHDSGAADGAAHGAAGDPEAPGVGLGLYLVRSLVEAMGGRVTVESEPGRGSVFSVRLPEWRGAVPCGPHAQLEVAGVAQTATRG